MRNTADRTMVNSRTCYSPSQGLVYLTNPKVACSSIKTSLWKAHDESAGVRTFAGNPHTRKTGPFVKNLFGHKKYDVSGLKTATFFSVVRNPFVRILSAYLDKIGRDRDPFIWRPFARRFGIRDSVTHAELSFRDFLVILSTEIDELLDVHFRPQYLNLLWPVCRPHFIGHMENLSEVSAFLAQHKVGIEAKKKYHSTGSRQLIEKYYKDDTVDLVRQKYAADFKIFGYSTDLAQIDEFASVEPGVGSCEPLTKWISDDSFPYELLDSQSQRFERFRGLTSREAKLKIVTKAYRTEDNWDRMQTYAACAVEAGEYSLAREAIDRIVDMRRQHCSLVQNASMFIGPDS